MRHNSEVLFLIIITILIFLVAYSMNTSVDLLSQIYETVAYSKNKVHSSLTLNRIFYA